MSLLYFSSTPFVSSCLYCSLHVFSFPLVSSTSRLLFIKPDFFTLSSQQAPPEGSVYMVSYCVIPCALTRDAYECVRSCDTPISPTHTDARSLYRSLPKLWADKSSLTLAALYSSLSVVCQINPFPISCHPYISGIKKSISLHRVQRGINLASVAWIWLFIIVFTVPHFLSLPFPFLMPGFEGKRRGWCLQGTGAVSMSPCITCVFFSMLNWMYVCVCLCLSVCLFSLSLICP